jgi:hypothetical protein
MRDKQWHTPSLDPLRATGARAETRAPRGSPRGSPRARGLTFRTSDLPSQAYYVAQTAPAEFKVRRDPDKTRRAGEREPSGRFPGSRPNRVSGGGSSRRAFSTSSSRDPAERASAQA